MSITSCFLIFLLCLSLHASGARRLRKVYTPENKLHFPIKTDTKNGSRKNTVAAVEEDGGVNHKSVVSVSWRVPHDKRGGGKHPGFNLDYSLPKTHPPSHY
ncbi:hypothetical protein HRI_001026100 [Hibiscus trionum]|uniref:Uncharacterized protein n=1 Tax=Hibiscus trionum TaxID=183268 RepID=A0A9W7HAW7_HIBTR|nr:hypothetical protein HRI_001026100 [Hibiscus trionum]